MSSKTRHLYEFGPFRLDPAERLLLRDGETVPLTPKAFEVLVALVEGGGRLVGKDELMSRLWPGSFVEEANLTNSVYALRKALGGESEGRRYVETVPKHGYRFAAEVRGLTDAPQDVLVVEKHTLTHTVTEEEVLPGGEPGAEPLEARSQLAPAEPRRVGSVAPAVLPRTKPRMSLSAWMAALSALTVVGASLVYFSRLTSEPPPPPMRVVPFTSFPGREDQAAFSPDGNQVAFVWGGEKDDNPDIYVKSVGGERPLRLTSDPGIDILPAWAPDGQRIAFLRISEGRFALHTVPALGGPERKLLPLSHHPQKISWSPDGNFIALVEKASGREAARILLYSPETGEKRVLTSPPAQAWGDFCPAFSPDGQTLAFMRASTAVNADLYLVPAAGGEPKRLTSDGSLHFYDQGVVAGLTWAADGRAIIYTSEAGGAPSLWRVSTSGGTPERLSVGGVDVFYPSISRHGNRLAYTQISGAMPIYQIEARGTTGRYGAPVRLISSTRSDLTPDFSPDGKRIAFASNRSGSYEIWVCDADGANPVQLTSFGGPHLGYPRWSPDGKQISFDVHATDPGDLYVVGVEGGRPRLVTTKAGVASWSGDGRWLYFASRRSGDEQVWKVPAEGGQPVQVTRHGGFTTYESADGRFLYYSKGPAGPGVWRVPADGGEETLILDAPGAGGWGGWAVVDEGIYFINETVKGERVVEFFSFATRGVTRVAALEDVNEFVGGLAVSPDRRRILYTQRERLAGDIMLVENFR